MNKLMGCFMKKKNFSKIKDLLNGKRVIVNTLDGNKIIGKCVLTSKNANNILIGEEQLNIKNIDTIDEYNPYELFKYVEVVYEDDELENTYFYKTDIKDIKEDDIVFVDRQGKKTTARVVNVYLFTIDNVPLSLDKTKDIISIVNNVRDTGNVEYKPNITVDGDKYYYTFNEMEQKVIDRLKDLGYNFKQYLRVILLLRTSDNSDTMCEKMLGFLENYNIDKLGTIEIEKYARLLATEVNFNRHSVFCPILNGNISVIDCLEISDEDMWKNKDKNFMSKCKNCKWHNPKIGDDEYINKEDITMVGLTEQLVKKIKYDDVIAFSIAESGAMGKAGNVEIITYADHELLGLSNNSLCGGLPFYKLYIVIPWLEQLQVGLGFAKNVGEGWKYISLGMGNHLFVRDYLYEDLVKLTKGKHESVIYKSWKKWCKEICSKKTYVKKTSSFRMKPREKDESIKHFFEKNYKDGLLPEDFSLSEFKHYKDDELTFVDGMLDFCCREDEDEDILELLKNIIKMVDDETAASACQLIDEYYEANPHKRVIGTIDIFLRWIMDNSKEIPVQKVFNLGICLLTCAQEIETIKIGIGLIGLVELNKNAKVIDLLKMYALSDEFTLYVNIALSSLENINDIRFELAQKLKGYGKLVIVPKLIIENEKIKEWVFSHGCENNIDNGWLAIDVASLIDLPGMIKEKTLNDVELNSVYNIVSGLINDEPKKGISVYQQKEELFVSLIQKNEELGNNLTYIKMLCMIKIYLENSNNYKYIELIDDILNTPIVKTLIDTNIKVGVDLIDIINISSCLEDVDIYDKVFKVFKENLKQGFENIAIDLLPYLMQKEEYVGNLLDEIRAKGTYKDILGNPEPIIELKDTYGLNIIIEELENYPLRGIDFVIEGLNCKYMYPRDTALNTIQSWLQKQDKKAKDYLPKDLYEELLTLKDKEVIKEYKEKINNILGIKEDLAKYEAPPVKYFKGKKTNEVNLYAGNIDSLFTNTIIERGKEYYDNNCVYNCVKVGSSYIAYVAGKHDEDYKVVINIDEDNNIKSMTCSCPNHSNCKHEYATILYIRNDD